MILRQWSLIWVAILFAEAQTFGFKEIRWRPLRRLNAADIKNEIDGEPLKRYGVRLGLVVVGLVRVRVSIVVVVDSIWWRCG